MSAGDRLSLRSVLGWALAALVGLVLAAAVTLAASKLSNQRIGLAGEPLTAGDQLTPARVHTSVSATAPVHRGDHERSDD